MATEKTGARPELVNIREACRIFGGVHPSTLRRWVKSGDAPAPVALGSRGVAAAGPDKNGRPRKPQALRWRRQELLDFIAGLPRTTDLGDP